MSESQTGGAVAEAQAQAPTAADAVAPPEAARAPERAAAEAERSASLDGRAQPIDFSQPTKFSTELRRRIERVLVPFCKALATRLSAELHAPVELRQVDSSQLAWSAARSRLSTGCLSVALETRPTGGQMLLGVELPFVLQSIECMLGGSASQAPDSRRLSEIDWALTRRLLESIVLQLSLVWRDLGGLELSLGEVDLEGDAGLFVPIGESTFAVEMQCVVAGRASTLSLLVPWPAIEPVVGEILGGWGGPDRSDPRGSVAMQRGLGAAKVLLRAEIGRTTLPVEQLLALEQGSMLRLKARAEHGVRLLAEGVSLARAMPGRSGIHRAVKLISPIEPEAQPGMRGPRSPRPGTLGFDASERRATREALRRLHGVSLEVWAELGRTRMPLRGALQLPAGAVLELDQEADDPVELLVNGRAFALGTLVVTSDGEWAVQVGALS